MSEILGIGSRVKHPAYGEGAIIKIDVAAKGFPFSPKQHVGINYTELP